MSVVLVLVLVYVAKPRPSNIQHIARRLDNSITLTGSLIAQLNVEDRSHQSDNERPV